MKNLYDFLTPEERTEWEAARGDDFREVFKRMQAKYFGGINSQFQAIHPEGQKRILNLLNTVESVTESLRESGDLWMSDYRKLMEHEIKLSMFVQGNISHLECEEVDE